MDDTSAVGADCPRGGKEVGAYDTPPPVVEGLLDAVLEPLIAARRKDGPEAVATLRVLDPACGAGNFVVAAGRRIAHSLRELGATPDEGAAEAFGRCVAGVDVDPVAVDTCRRAVGQEAGGALAPTDVTERIRLGNALLAALPDSVGAGGIVDGVQASRPLQFPGLNGDPDLWTTLASRPDDNSGWTGFDLVIGNPPFLNQRQRHTTASPDVVVGVRRRFGDAVGALTDPAAIFLVLGMELARTGGTVCLIEPTSVLSARTAGAAREAVDLMGELAGLWVAGEAVFDAAAVDVCAPILRRGHGAAPRTVALYRGRSVEPAGTSPGMDGVEPPSRPNPPTSTSMSTPSPTPPPARRRPRPWVELAANAAGLPERNLACDGVLGDLGAATADFRDQYYGLVGLVREEVDGDAAHTVTSRPPCTDARAPITGGAGTRSVRLITTGLVDPAELAWGDRPARIHKTTYERPVVDLNGLDGAMATWATRRLVPKVLVASQTRAIEALVDAEGRLLPSVPLVSVSATSGSVEDLWRIAAVLSSPPVTLVAARRHFGAGLGRGALKLSAADLLDLPLPAFRPAWEDAAGEIRAAHGSTTSAERRVHLVGAARAMLRAYGLAPADDLLTWWTDRLPRGSRRPI